MDTIIDFINNLLDIIEFIFKCFVTVFDLLFKGIEILIHIITILPTPFLAAGVALVSVSVLYKVLGRESSD